MASAWLSRAAKAKAKYWKRTVGYSYTDPDVPGETWLAQATETMIWQRQKRMRIIARVRLSDEYRLWAEEHPGEKDILPEPSAPSKRAYEAAMVECGKVLQCYTERARQVRGGEELVTWAI